MLQDTFMSSLDSDKRALMQSYLSDKNGPPQDGGPQDGGRIRPGAEGPETLDPSDPDYTKNICLYMVKRDVLGREISPELVSLGNGILAKGMDGRYLSEKKRKSGPP